MSENNPEMDCPGCGQRLHLPEGSEDWVHKGLYSTDCPLAGPDVEEEPLPEVIGDPNHPVNRALSQQFGEVINVDFKNRKRLD